MASNELIIDDVYCRSMGTYFETQGHQIDHIISQYVSILQEVKSKAIVSGEVADALSAFISYASKLNKQIGNISTTAMKQVNAFLSNIDSADQYLY